MRTVIEVAASIQQASTNFSFNSTAKKSIKQVCEGLFSINEGDTTISPEIPETEPEVIVGTIILPSLEELKEQEFFEDPIRVEKALYEGLFLEFFGDSIDEKLNMDWRISQRHRRKEKCCTKWNRHSDSLGRYHTKKTNPCGCLECEKCIPSKINGYRKGVYSKYGPVIYVKYAARFDIKVKEDIDRAYMLRTYWRQVCSAEGKSNVSIQIVNNGIILVSNDIEQVKIPEHLLDDEDGITHDGIEIVNVENNSSHIIVKNFQDFARRYVYYEIPQDVADYWFENYSGQKKILHVGCEMYEKPKPKIACAEVISKETEGTIEPVYYAQTWHSEPISEKEAMHMGTAIYIEIDAPNVVYGLHDGYYVTLENFVRKVDLGSDNSYVTDWLLYFGSGEKSIKLLLKLKKQYEKKNDDGGWVELF